MNKEKLNIIENYNFDVFESIIKNNINKNSNSNILKDLKYEFDQNYDVKDNFPENYKLDDFVFNFHVVLKNNNKNVIFKNLYKLDIDYILYNTAYNMWINDDLYFKESYGYIYGIIFRHLLITKDADYARVLNLMLFYKNNLVDKVSIGAKMQELYSELITDDCVYVDTCEFFYLINNENDLRNIRKKLKKYKFTISKIDLSIFISKKFCIHYNNGEFKYREFVKRSSSFEDSLYKLKIEARKLKIDNIFE